MVFMSRSKRLRVVLKPSFYVIDANGQRVSIPGKTVEFMNGRWEEHDPQTIALLLKHDLFGSKFTCVEDEGAWREMHPEYFHSPVTMIDGAVATVNSAVPPMFEAAKAAGVQQIVKQSPVVKGNQSVDLDSIIGQKIEEKFAPLADKIDQLLRLASEPIEAPKPKKTFKCPVPGCDFVGKTGIEIGAHKKEVHSA